MGAFIVLLSFLMGIIISHYWTKWCIHYTARAHGLGHWDKSSGEFDPVFVWSCDHCTARNAEKR